MSKPENNEFLANLLKTLDEFHQYQRNNTDRATGHTPYEYDTLGFAEWLTFNKGIEL